jgi:hypothetical protein
MKAHTRCTDDIFEGSLSKHAETAQNLINGSMKYSRGMTLARGQKGRPQAAI